MSVTVLYDESALFYADLFARTLTLNDGLNISGGSLGSILYNNGTNYVSLSSGTNNQVLTMSGGVPIWTTGAGATIPDPLSLNKINVNDIEDNNLGTAPINILSDVQIQNGKKLLVGEIDDLGLGAIDVLASLRVQNTLEVNTISPFSGSALNLNLGGNTIATIIETDNLSSNITGTVTIGDNVTINSPKILTTSNIDLDGSAIFNDASTNLGLGNFSAWYFQNGVKAIATGSTPNYFLKINAAGTAVEWAPTVGSVPDPLPVNIITSNPPGLTTTLDDNTIISKVLSISSTGELEIDNTAVVTDKTTTVDGFLHYYDDTGTKQELQFNSGSVGDVVSIAPGGKSVQFDTVSALIPDPLNLTELQVSIIKSKTPGVTTIDVQDNIFFTSVDVNMNTSNLVFNSASELELSAGTSVKDNTVTTNGFDWYFNSTNDKTPLQFGTGNSVKTMNAGGTAPIWSQDLDITSVTAPTINTDTINPDAGTTIAIGDSLTNIVKTQELQVYNLNVNATYGSGILVNSPLQINNQITIGSLTGKLQWANNSLENDSNLNVTGGIKYYNTAGDIVRLPFTASPASNSVVTTNATNNALQFTNNISVQKGTFTDGVIVGASSNPSAPTDGQVYYNTVAEELRAYDGTIWHVIGSNGSMDLGALTITGGATNTTFTIVNSDVTVKGTFVLNGLSNNFSQPSNGVLRYDGTTIHTFKVTFNCSYSGNDNTQIEFSVYKNASRQTPVARSWLDDNNGTQTAGMNWLISLATNDTLTMYVRNVTDLGLITVRELSLMVHS